MRASMKVAKLDFFTMKSQLFSYLSLAAIVLMFGFMGSSVTVLCITGAWFVALQASSIFAIQEKNNLDHLYGSVSVGLNDIVLGRYIFMYVNYLITFLAVIALYFGFAFYRNAAISIQDIMFGFSLSFLVFFCNNGNTNALIFQNGLHQSQNVVFDFFCSSNGIRVNSFFCIRIVWNCKKFAVAHNRFNDWRYSGRQYDSIHFVSNCCCSLS